MSSVGVVGPPEAEAIADIEPLRIVVTGGVGVALLLKVRKRRWWERSTNLAVGDVRISLEMEFRATLAACC